MEPGLMAAAAGVSSHGASSRAPCRNFSRGTCRWGQNCRFSHDRKSSQICRHFQNGFCCYGDRCNYQHTPPLLPEEFFASRRSSEPAVHVPLASLLSSRHGSDSSLAQRPPLCPAWTLGRRGSEPALSSVTELQMNFEQLNTDFEEAEEDAAEDTAAGPASVDWALAAEFIPRYTLLEGSRSRERGLQRSLSDPAIQEKKVCGETRRRHQEGHSTRPIAAGPDAPKEVKVLSGRDTVTAFERSKEVICGICMDKVYEKTLPHERLFGILPKCNHSYCVGCIRKWRKSRDFQSEVIKGCPQCRVTSSYFIPHKYWISDAKEKEKLVETFTGRTSKIRCRFFVRGHGHCPFKSDCIYLHELPPGQHPRRRPEQRRASATVPYSYFVEMLDDDDDFEEDFYLLQCAVALTILERSHGFEILLGCSDSD